MFAGNPLEKHPRADTRRGSPHAAHQVFTEDVRWYDAIRLPRSLAIKKLRAVMMLKVERSMTFKNISEDDCLYIYIIIYIYLYL